MYLKVPYGIWSAGAAIMAVLEVSIHGRRIHCLLVYRLMHKVIIYQTVIVIIIHQSNTAEDEVMLRKYHLLIYLRVNTRPCDSFNKYI